MLLLTKVDGAVVVQHLGRGVLERELHGRLLLLLVVVMMLLTIDAVVASGCVDGGVGLAEEDAHLEVVERVDGLAESPRVDQRVDLLLMLDIERVGLGVRGRRRGRHVPRMMRRRRRLLMTTAIRIVSMMMMMMVMVVVVVVSRVAARMRSIGRYCRRFAAAGSVGARVEVEYWLQRVAMAILRVDRLLLQSGRDCVLVVDVRGGGGARRPRAQQYFGLDGRDLALRGHIGRVLAQEQHVASLSRQLAATAILDACHFLVGGGVVSGGTRGALVRRGAVGRLLERERRLERRSVGREILLRSGVFDLRVPRRTALTCYGRRYGRQVPVCCVWLLSGAAVERLHGHGRDLSRSGLFGLLGAKSERGAVGACPVVAVGCVVAVAASGSARHAVLASIAASQQAAGHLEHARVEAVAERVGRVGVVAAAVGQQDGVAAAVVVVAVGEVAIAIVAAAVAVVVVVEIEGGAHQLDVFVEVELVGPLLVVEEDARDAKRLVEVGRRFASGRRRLFVTHRRLKFSFSF